MRAALRSSTVYETLSTARLAFGRIGDLRLYDFR